MKWFGEPWPSDKLRAPVCVNDADRIPVPFGEPCLYCRELIEEDDRGEQMGSVVADDDGQLIAAVGYAHVECLFRQVVGGPAHLQGRCTCCGGSEDPDLDMSAREAARWVWEHYSDLSYGPTETFHKYDDPPEEGRV